MKNENLSFWLDILKIAIGVVLAVVGWIVGYRLASRNTREQKRRDIAVEHLIAAYRSLTNEIARSEDVAVYDKLGAVLLDIQLFGSPDQVRMAIELARNISPGVDYDLEPLVQSLRTELRSELNLPPVGSKFALISFRIKK